MLRSQITDGVEAEMALGPFEVSFVQGFINVFSSHDENGFFYQQVRDERWNQLVKILKGVSIVKIYDKGDFLASKCG